MTHQEELEPDMTRAEVVRRLGVSAERLRQLTAAGRLSCRRTPLGAVRPGAGGAVRRRTRSEAPAMKLSPYRGRAPPSPGPTSSHHNPKINNNHDKEKKPMSITTTPAAGQGRTTGFRRASLPNTADELLGRLLLLKPTEMRQFETKHGSSEAIPTSCTSPRTGRPPSSGNGPSSGSSSAGSWPRRRSSSRGSGAGSSWPARPTGDRPTEDEDDLLRTALAQLGRE